MIQSKRVLIGLAAIVLAAQVVSAAEVPFLRGDVNNDQAVNIGDPIQLLAYLFGEGDPLDCMDAADVDDSGMIDIADAINELNYIFGGGVPPMPPGPTNCGFDPTVDAISCVSSLCDGLGDPGQVAAGHLLNRIAYGPVPGAVDAVVAAGIDAVLISQLNPDDIDESTNVPLVALENFFSDSFPIADQTFLYRPNGWFRYFLGEEEPPANWAQPGFDDSVWARGPAGFGRGDNDDLTEFDQFGTSGVVSLYIRNEILIPTPTPVGTAFLRIDYDDGFVAYLNGVEFARSSNINGTPPPFSATTTNGHEAGVPEYFPIPVGMLLPGINVLAVQGHNQSPTNFDFSLHPTIVSTLATVDAARLVIQSRSDLQRYPFIRGIYSRRQLQTVLGEFWENHFTTDFDKVLDLYRNLRNRYDHRVFGSSTGGQSQAADVEFTEYDFFTENALGNFGDLLLHSAASPAMLIYLDNILNFAAQPNENYAREILELHSLGVDNGYTQTDIEEVARCFTGWTITRIPDDMVQPFPDYVTSPVTTEHHSWTSTALMEVGEVWNYLPGVEEPTPDINGEPTTAWAEVGYDDSTWLQGPTGIGYGDNDDATVLNDMQNGYVSFYARKTFDVPDAATNQRLEIEIDYDDGVVVYLNGLEVGRSRTMNGRGTPPPFSSSSGGHEANRGNPLYIDLDLHRALLLPTGNVLAVQVHNAGITSGDCSFLPRITSNTPTPRHVDYSDRQGHWTFRFNPGEHDDGPKTLFDGTPYQINIPPGRVGADGVLDALDVIDGLVAHPNTAEFICMKLIQRFVSDDISLATIHDGSAPIELQSLLASMVAAWYSTAPPGNIGTVLGALLDPVDQQGPFWDPANQRSKVKTPVEFINFTLRSLNASASTDDLAFWEERMGMDLFQRDDPDGYPEVGSEWIGTTTLLERINFARRFASNVDNDYQWELDNFVNPTAGLGVSEVLAVFDDVLFQSTLTEAEKCIVIDYVETDVNGQPWPLDPQDPGYRDRVRDMVGFLFSLPRWQFQ